MIKDFSSDYKIGTYYLDGCPWEIWQVNGAWWLKRDDMTIFWPAEDRLMIATQLFSKPTIHYNYIEFSFYDDCWMELECSPDDFIQYVFPSLFDFELAEDIQLLHFSPASKRFRNQIGEYVAEWEERKNLTK